MMRKTEILPLEVVLEDMGINWWYGTEKEVQETLENLDAAFAEIKEKKTYILAEQHCIKK